MHYIGVYDLLTAIHNGLQYDGENAIQLSRLREVLGQRLSNISVSQVLTYVVEFFVFYDFGQNWVYVYCLNSFVLIITYYNVVSSFQGGRGAPSQPTPTPAGQSDPRESSEFYSDVSIIYHPLIHTT